MCGRFSVFVPQSDLEDRFDVEVIEPIEPRYNIAPMDNINVIANDDPNRFDRYQWGFQPHWWDEEKQKGRPPINARAETLVEKPWWKEAIADRAAEDARLAITLLRPGALHVQAEGLDELSAAVVNELEAGARESIREQHLDSLGTHRRLLYEVIGGVTGDGSPRRLRGSSLESEEQADTQETPTEPGGLRIDRASWERTGEPISGFRSAVYLHR